MSCVHCGAPIAPPKVKYCSQRCCYAARDARPEVKERQKAQKRAAYVPTGRPPGRVRKIVQCTVDACISVPLARGLCRPHYRAAAYAAGVPWACEGNKAFKKRAERFGVPYEPVNRVTVFERDGWVCGICGDPVDHDDASLDHVTPMSLGGAHSYANTQCSHLSCNIRKGARADGRVHAGQAS